MKIEKTTKKQKTSKYAKRALIIILAISIVTICLLAILYNRGYFNKPITEDNSSLNLDPPTEEQKQAGEEIKKTTTSNSNTNNDLGLSFSSISQTNDQLKVKVTISGLVSNNGSCNLKLQKDDQSFEYTKPTFALTSYSTCQGFDIDIKDYSRGEWTITLSVSVNDKSSTINKIITLE